MFALLAPLVSAAGVVSSPLATSAPPGVLAFVGGGWVFVGVGLQCLLVLESTVTKIAYQMIIIAMVEQIPGGIKYRAGVELTSI